MHVKMQGPLKISIFSGLAYFFVQARLQHRGAKWGNCMSKRFIDTKIFDKNWFGEVDSRRKLLWFYLFCECDSVGIWEVNFKKASFDLGEPITRLDIEALGLGSRIIEVSYTKMWLTGFIKFQYKNLNVKNPSQRSMMKSIVEAVSNLPLINESFDLIEKFKSDIVAFNLSQADTQPTPGRGSTDPHGNGNGNGKGRIKSAGEKNIIRTQIELDRIEEIKNGSSGNMPADAKILIENLKKNLKTPAVTP